MKLLVISAAPLVNVNTSWYLYSPYEKEMRIWAKNASTIQFCCPIWNPDKGMLIEKVSFPMEISFM